MEIDGSLRVLHCLETIGSGGVERRRILLARRFFRTPITQRIVCSYVMGSMDAKFLDLGVQLNPIGRFSGIWSVSKLFKVLQLIRQFRPHIIHGAVFEGVTIAVVCGILGRVPVIIIEETSDPQNRSWRGHLLFKILSFFADFVVAISPSVKEYLVKRLRIPERKAKLINNGVEPSELNLDQEELTKIKHRFGINDNDFIVGSTGRLRDYHKRFSDLIKAMKLLKEDIPQCKLLIVGDGEDRDTLEALCIKLGVEDRVIFVGYQDQTGYYYACMDVFSLASHMEGFGLVIVEAMFHKLPVVATAVGGIKDIVLDGKTGFLVDRHSPESLARAIRDLYNQPELRRAMGLAGYNRAAKEFSADAYTTKVEMLYREALQKKGLSFGSQLG